MALLGGCAATPAAPLPTPPGATAAPSAPTLPAPTPAPTLAPPPAPTAAPTVAPTEAPATAAPSLTPAPSADLAVFEAAMRPGFEGDIAANADLPRYDLRLAVDPASGTLLGQSRVAYTNRTGAPLPDLALRLYPNFPRDTFGRGGDTRMDVTAATVAGQPVEWRYAASETAVLLPLAQPLEPGQVTTITVSFSAAISPGRDGAYLLAQYYPMLAVREGAAWRLDVTNFADRVFAESALYRAEITAPAELVVVTTGSIVATSPGLISGVTHIVVSGPAREFAFSIGNFEAARATSDDIAVNVYAASGSQLAAGQVAEVAAGALAVFERRFGPYPYRELDVHLLPGQFDGGDEYTGLVVVTSGGPVDAGTRYVTAHEVAHQWWYSLVGNDIYREPWLDEAFAQFSGVLYAEDALGPEAAAADWQREVQRRYAGALADGDLPVGRAIDGYPSFDVYYRTVYGKGAVFLRRLREQLGDQAFFDGLQRYFQANRYRVGSTNAVRQALEAASGQDLAAEFQNWVGR